MEKINNLTYIYEYKYPKETPRENIESMFNPKCRQSLINGIKNAYKWVEVWEQQPSNQVMLKYSGKSARGNVLCRAVTYFLIEEVKKGKLDLNFRLDYTKWSKVPYLVLFDEAKNIEITVNQESRGNKPARAALNRFERINNNFMTTLFDTEGEEDLTPFYYQLIHGYQGKLPDFVNLGIPNDELSWLEVIDLTQETHVIENEKLTNSQAVVINSLSLDEMQNVVNEVMDDE